MSVQIRLCFTPTLLILFLLIKSGLVQSSRNFTVVNNCDFTVWPAILSDGGAQPLSTTGFALEKGESKTIKSPPGWSGRFLGRTGCTQGFAGGNFSCLTGDCGSGKIECLAESAAPPVTLAEFTLDAFSGGDFYDVSLVRGYNLPMLVVPQDKNCTTTGCVLDLNEKCPLELRVSGTGGETIGCKSPCQAYGSVEFCCNATSKNRCEQMTYSQVVKKECPLAYSYSGDDITSTFPCSGADYLITFCPDQNTWLQSTPPSNEKSVKHKGKQRLFRFVVLPVILLLLGLVLLGFGYYCFVIRKRNKRVERKQSQEVLLLNLVDDSLADEYSNDDFDEEKTVKSQKFPFIGLDLIQAATRNFAQENKLGEGGFGPVYKGILVNGKEIAIKRLSGTSGQGLREFKNEITLIAKLQHRNLVRIFGCCLEGNEALLIYEYMPNKSLDTYIFDQSHNNVQLDWKERFNIIHGIARGLCYLHEDSQLRVIHRDLKASNILLDKQMNPKISDFGMARIFGGNEIEANTNRVVGTYGYMAPEYAMEGVFSIKSDVFSFGVLMLEIVNGRRNHGYLNEHGESLLSYAWQLWHKGQGEKLMDPSLAQSCIAAEVMKCIHISLLCVQHDPTDRPTMSSILSMLRNETMTLPNPKQPTFSLTRSDPRLIQPLDTHAWSSSQITHSYVLPR